MKHWLTVFFVAIVSYGNAQNPEYLKRYTPSVYNAGAFVYHLLQDNYGILYFATDKGLVQYDGSRWLTIEMGVYTDTRYIAMSEDEIIFVGANNDFGYLQQEPNGNLLYISLANEIRDIKSEIGEVWQVAFSGPNVYFQSYEAIYKWNHEKIEIIHLPESYIFDIDGVIFGSSFLTLKFGPILGDSIVPVKNYEILNDVVYQTFQYDTSHWLIITSEEGLFLYNVQSESLTRFDCEESEYLKKYYFFDGIKISDNLYAFGTWEGGMIFSDKQGKILDTLNRKSGLLANMVYHGVMGNNDDLWLGTSDGIAKMDLDSLDNVQFLVDDDHTNDITLVREFIATGEETNYHYWYRASQDSTLVLPFTSNPTEITFHYATPKMAGEEVEYSVKLEGLDEGWSDWNKSDRKEYTMLGKGDYSFRIKARDSSGKETMEAGFNFKINIPWYKTIQLYLLVVGIIGVVSFGFVQLRTLQLKYTNQKLEKLVSERTHDLVKQQKRLKKTNIELLNTNEELDNFVYHTSHDLKAPLKSVLGLIGISKLETEKNTELTKYLEMMEKSIHKLEEFILSIIEYSTNVKAELGKEMIDFDKIIDASCDQLNEYRNLKDINFERKIDVTKPFYSDPQRLKIIFNNLITNAVKYHNIKQEKPYIKILVEGIDDELQIKVEDNGQGIKDELKDKIFNMFFRASEKSSGSGLGLYIVKETIAKLGGKISVNTSYGTGSSFTILFTYTK